MCTEDSLGGTLGLFVLCYYLIRKDLSPKATVTQKLPSFRQPWESPNGSSVTAALRGLCHLAQWVHSKALPCSEAQLTLGFCWSSGIKILMGTPESQVSPSSCHSLLHYSYLSSQNPECIQNVKSLEVAPRSRIIWLPRTSLSYFPVFISLRAFAIVPLQTVCVQCENNVH